MRVKEIRSQHRNDFYWIGECEHCDHVDTKTRAGYDDVNYHERVIPALKCPTCGLNSAGQASHPTC